METNSTELADKSSQLKKVKSQLDTANKRIDQLEREADQPNYNSATIKAEKEAKFEKQRADMAESELEAEKKKNA